MQFQVPQFIETEDKIVGPLTLRQFIYIAVAALISFFLFFVLQTWLWLIITAILGTAAAALAFVKYHGRPLIVILFAAVSYLWKPRFYLWKRTEPAVKPPELKLEKITEALTPEKPKEKKPLLQNLWLKLHTMPRSQPEQRKTAAIHEKFKSLAEEKQTPAFEILRKATGERQSVKRVDYR